MPIEKAGNNIENSDKPIAHTPHPAIPYLWQDAFLSVKNSFYQNY